MKILIKIGIAGLFLLTSCTDKKSGNSNTSSASEPNAEEIEKIETLTNEMDEATKDIEATAKKLDDILGEIDN